MPPVIAHNAKFDTSFLQQSVAASNWCLVWDKEAPSTCTHSMFRALFQKQGADLTGACRACSIDTTGREEGHDALQDAQLCAKLFIHLARLWKSAYTTSVSV
ncbi:hypothetical protein TRVL_01397 [Trypanosoma vivax]|nr:hypothetical protein TRVL_01397 [Trypanosoma vivax]